jgi:hypothetical protein
MIPSRHVLMGRGGGMMKKKWILLPALLLIAGSALPEPQKPVRPADALRGMDEISAQLVQLDQCHARIVALNEKMVAVFSSFRQKVNDTIASAASGSDSSQQLLQATKRMQETQMSFNL